MQTTPKMYCVIHGSFSKHFDEILRVAKLFTSIDLEVLAPKMEELSSSVDGFALFEDEIDKDPRLVELLYLHNLKKIGANGFSYFVNPEGYIGKSASYELGIAQLTNVRCFFSDPLDDHPAYTHKNSVWSADGLAEYIQNRGVLPNIEQAKNERLIHKLWTDLMVPGSVIAAGAIIDYDPGKTVSEREILLVQTHKWGDRYSVVGGKVRRNELLADALRREIKEETGLNGQIGKHLATFDQIKNSGYYDNSVHHVYVDNVFTVKSKKVTLNDEAQDHLWIRPSDALKHLDIEPNARHIVELYHKLLV